MRLPLEHYMQGHATDDAIDIAGTAASAKLTLVHGEVTFVDYFVLLKTEYGWKIANKAFYAQTN